MSFRKEHVNYPLSETSIMTVLDKNGIDSIEIKKHVISVHVDSGTVYSHELKSKESAHRILDKVLEKLDLVDRNGQ